MNPSIMPGFIYLLGAIWIPFIKGQIRKIYLVAISAIALIYIWQLPNPTQPLKLMNFEFLSFQITMFQIDRLSWFCAFIFALIGLIGTVYSLGIEEDYHHVLSFIYIGASLGAVFAGDFLTLYIFWEIMALAPTFLVWFTKKEESIQAGFRYLVMHTIGGLMLLGGIMLNYAATGSMVLAPIKATGLGFWLALAGIGLNAGFILLHTWLPDTYPRASYAGSVFLCVYTTKTAVYVLARTFAGSMLVAYLGGIMAVYGVSYALLQNNARRLLSYHVLSQVGYMVAGVGMGATLGLDGAIGHLFNHILYKALLFMSVGSIIYMTGRERLTDMGGLAKKMPVTFLTCLIGALSISGVPGFNGYISKSLLLAEAHKYGSLLILLELAAVGTFLSFCKLIYYAFLNKPEEEIEAEDPPIHMKLAMLAAAFLCIFYGVVPSALTKIMPIPINYHFYEFGHTFDTILLLGTTFIVFNLARKVYSPHKVIIYDFDWIYIRIAHALIWVIRNPVFAIGTLVDKIVTWLMVTLWQPLTNPQAVMDTLNRYVFAPLALKVPWQDRAAVGYVYFCDGSKAVDSTVVDGAVNGTAEVTYALGEKSRQTQTGFLHQYAQVIAMGLLILLSLSLYYF